MATLLIAVTLVFASFVFAGAVFDWISPFAGAPFDRNVWHSYADSREGDSPRAAMVADLRSNHLVPGLAQTKVKELLGTPEVESPNLYQYVIGAWSGFRFDDDFLYIHFDDQGQLTHVETVQH